MTSVRPEILVTPSLPAPTLAALDSAFATHRWDADLPDAVLARIRGLAASTLAGPIDAKLLARMPSLEIIANFGVGYDNIAIDAAIGRGVMVTNTAGVLDDEVADFTVGLLLATVRRIPAAERFLRAGGWRHGAFPLSPSLRGRRIGIVGLGAIGKAVARRLDGFGLRIAYHGRHKQDGVAWNWVESVETLARDSDVLIVIVPGGPGTRHLVDDRVLAALGPDGILVNVARGSVVDEDALIEALQKGWILAAGLDVFAHEPDVPEALLALDNAVLLPHIGSASVPTRVAMGQTMVDNLVAWFATGHALTPVSEARALNRD